MFSVVSNVSTFGRRKVWLVLYKHGKTNTDISQLRKILAIVHFMDTSWSNPNVVEF